MKVHDAELCERIRKLEERVRELEARPRYNPYPYITWTYPPQWTWNSTGTLPNATTTYYSVNTSADNELRD